MSGGFLDRLAYRAAEGAHVDQTRRYLFIRPEALMGIFRRLPPDARDAALGALAESVFEMGSDSARAYAAMGGDGPALAETVRLSAPELGWGVWDIALEPGRMVATVANSPFAEGFGPSETPVCHAILGMVRAVGTMVLGGPVRATEVACAACGAAECRFEAERTEAKP
jgi:predicted hydrocarbon binding protein